MENLTRDSASRGGVNLIRWGLKVGFIVTAAIAIAASAHVQQAYTITDLGVVSTVNGTSSGDTDSHATAINNSGTVVGYSGAYSAALLGYLNQDAFIWRCSI
jgi:hypothetical protein